MRSLGAPEASGVHLVFDRWADVVGEALAARTQPLKIEGKRLVLAVDEPAIATHVNFLQAELLARLAQLLAPDRAVALALRVGRQHHRAPSALSCHTIPGLSQHRRSTCNVFITVV